MVARVNVRTILGTSRSRFFSDAFGCPALSGNNREAGETPARSRHCEDRRSEATMQKPGDLPGRCLQLSNASRKGVQAALGNLFSEKDPVASLSLSRGRKVTGFVFSTYFGELRQRRRFRSTARSKAASRYACRRTPNSVDCGADPHPNDVVRRSTTQHFDFQCHSRSRR